LSLVAMRYCPRCGATLGQNATAGPDGCGACPTVAYHFSRLVRLGPYAQPLRAAITDLKYRRQEMLRRRLGKLLAMAIEAACSCGMGVPPMSSSGNWAREQREGTHGQDARATRSGMSIMPLGRPDLVLAIPMHWRRRFSRGCDHAGMIAGTIARELGLPIGDELVRCRHTPPQARLSRTRRIENVKGAFVAREAKTLAGAHVLLVDDVSTTGATADEAAKTLLAAGASSVTLAILAKAQPPKAYA
jgi:predicted amidophosphoribosyltransferase